MSKKNTAVYLLLSRKEEIYIYKVWLALLHVFLTTESQEETQLLKVQPKNISKC